MNKIKIGIVVADNDEYKTLKDYILKGDYEDYSILQISSITNTHVNTVKKQLSRARAMLAKLLHKEDFVL